jgi:predicted O-linked N-acetylglucosamine transferase (SPINDLY family)
VARSRKGQHLPALRHLHKACQAAPQVALYWLNLASVQNKLHAHDEALASARRAVQLDPGCRLSCHLLAELLRQTNQPAQALQVLRGLQGDSRQDAQHWLLQGAMLAALGQHAQAAQAFLQVLALQPGDVQAYMQLGYALAAQRQFVEAAECFRAVTMIDPSQLGAAIHAAHYADWACDWAQGAQDRQRLAQAFALQAQSGAPGTGFSPFCLLAMGDDPQLALRGARLEAARQAQEIRQRCQWVAPLPGPQGHPQAAKQMASGRCRIGLVSADFRTHATGMLLVQTLENLDRDRFELLLYSHGASDGTPLRRRIEAAADQFVDCSTLSLAQQAQRIRDDGVTVLIDMSGYTTGSRLQLFALRPAPVQAVWLAYPGSLGAEGWVDYLIGDPVITPLAFADDYTEKLAQLPVCYEPTDERREHPETTASRSEVGLPEDAFVYACFNQSYKISEPVFTRWCSILQRVPQAVLWLLVPQAHLQAALRQRAVERGIDPQRLVFAPFVTPTEHLARLPLADVFLDTFPYGAHTTCSDALWMGLPVLTLVGRSFPSRVAASLLGAVGLADLAVDDAQVYEEMAVRLAEDPEALTDIRDHLWDNRRDLPLFDNIRFAAELSDLLARMAGRWQQGLPPEHLPA